MKRITPTRLAFCTTLSLVALLGISGVAQPTPVSNGASIETRTFNDCPISTVTTINNYPALIEIKDVMDPGCVGFANLHSWSFSTDGGATAAVFNNPSNFRFSASFKLDGAGEGEGGLRISPWYGKFVDGRFMANATTGEVACFGGPLPFYSFTANHGVVYVKGTTIRLEVTYLAHDLFSTDPASIQYRVIYNNITYDSPVLDFGQQNPNECDPNGLWGMLNDGRAGAYFQPRANTGAALTARWTNIKYEVLPDDGTPVPNAASIELRTFNDCPISTLATTNSYPALIRISDTMDPGCVGFANLHSWSFSDDGGATAAPYHDNSHFHYFADFKIEGAGEGEGGLRISPWYGKFVDGRFMANATTGEVACFGGPLPFYSFTGNHGITYVKGTTIHLDVTYDANDLVSTDPATIRYRVGYNGNTYDSPVLPFGKQNASECNPYYLWGMLNDGRAGAYFQPRANTGANLTGTWSNIRYSTCTDPVDVAFKFRPRKLNLNSKDRFVTAYLTPSSPHTASEIVLASIRLNGLPVDAKARVRIVRDCDRDDDDDVRQHGNHKGGKGDDDHRGGDRHGRCPSTLVVKFDRHAFAGTVTPGESVPVLISGLVGSDCFEETTNIRVRAPHMNPDDDDVVAPASVTELNWDREGTEGLSSLSLFSSADGGESWTIVNHSVPNTGTYRWTAPAQASGSMRLAIGLIEEEDEDGIITDVEASETGTFRVGSATGIGPGTQVGFGLQGLVPNPSRGLNVSFSLPSSKSATLVVYDVTGRQVSAREVGTLGPGLHSVSVASPGTLRAGVYLVQLTQGAEKRSARAVVLP